MHTYYIVFQHAINRTWHFAIQALVNCIQSTTGYHMQIFPTFSFSQLFLLTPRKMMPGAGGLMWTKGQMILETTVGDGNQAKLPSLLFYSQGFESQKQKGKGVECCVHQQLLFAFGWLQPDISKFQHKFKFIVAWGCKKGLSQGQYRVIHLWSI